MNPLLFISSDTKRNRRKSGNDYLLAMTNESLDEQKLKRARQQYLGFILAGVGALLGFISCVLTLWNPIPSIYDLVLYGLTSFAIIVIFAGLYLMIEGTNGRNESVTEGRGNSRNECRIGGVKGSDNCCPNSSVKICAFCVICVLKNQGLTGTSSYRSRISSSTACSSSR
jgi:hypothetical protein